MNENVKKSEQADNFKAAAGIGLYKIRYEMDVKDSTRESGYMAGVIAYTSKEAVDTLINFAKNKIKGFKGMKVEEVAYEGACHSLSDAVKDAIINTAKLEGDIVSKKEYDLVVKEAAAELKAAKGKKQSILQE